MAELKQAAKNELLQHEQGLSSALQSDYWRTIEGQQLLCQVSEMYHQLANRITEECGPVLDSDPDVFAPAPPSSPSREELAEGKAAAEEVFMPDEGAGKEVFCVRELQDW